MDASLAGIFRNRILLTGTVGWASAQILKAIIYAVVNKEFRVERLFGDGGMPSAHSATVTSVAISAGILCGFDSPLFGIAAILAVIVMHDAMGVRLETGKQAKVINEMMEAFARMGDAGLSPEERLKEFVGHTPLQVVSGAVLGLIVACVMNLR